MIAVIPAAGRGTRMRPVTDVVSKEILPVGGKPAIHHVVDEAVQAGITEIVVVIAPDKGELREYLGDETRFPDAVDIHFTIQSDPRGLGDAILQARPIVREARAFAVLYPDNIVLQDPPAIGTLIDLHRRLEASVSHVVEVPRPAIADYSSIDATQVEPGLHRVHDMVEKPEPDDAPSTLAPIGRHVLTLEIFDVLERTDPGHGGEIQLTDAIASIAKQDEHYARELDGNRLDVGNHAGFLEANVVLGLEWGTIDAQSIDRHLPRNRNQAATRGENDR